ncbi:MAG: 2-hydroxyacid dehydrogenase [Polynucleobacter sp.]|jgi:lactate dehydrogenase-like 2-hydroxyacid dehydrogenase|nr:2-hydroxyacid dehydrogenase [Polynucleobacter sp.]
MIPANLVLQIGFFPEIMQVQIDRRLQTIAMADPKSAPPPNQCTAILTRASYPLSPALLDQLPNIKMIANCSVGYDNLPLTYLKERGILASNTPGVLNDAVCELTIGLLINLLRQIPEAHQFTTQGKWSKETYPFTTSLAGKNVGIVGMGRIGQELAERLVPFKVNLAYTGPKPKSLPYTYFNNILELANASDILILSCPGGPETEKMVNAEVLNALGSKGFLINVARGTVVNESDLIQALENKTIAGAALDVFANEPNPNPAFFKLESLIMVPHIGSATQETRLAMTNLAIDNLEAFFQQKPLPTPIKFT